MESGIKSQTSVGKRGDEMINERVTDKPDSDIRVLRVHKDTVFRMLFRDRDKLLSLFNAVNGTHYENPEKLQVHTLENAIYMNMKNDVSCMLDERLNLYEHQSTVNPNMPLRNLFYISRLYETLIRKEEIYGSRAVQLPNPHFIVFYNGEEEQPERRVMHLSSLYTKETREPGLELVVVQLNINEGYNEELKKSCEPLFGYMAYVGKVRKYQKEPGIPLNEAVDRSVNECIREGILADFFQKNRAEVIQMSIFEYDEEAHMRLIREEGREKGREEGRERTMIIVNRLLSDNRMSDLKRAAEDEGYLKSLMEEYHVTG